MQDLTFSLLNLENSEVSKPGNQVWSDLMLRVKKIFGIQRKAKEEKDKKSTNNKKEVLNLQYSHLLKDPAKV